MFFYQGSSDGYIYIYICVCDSVQLTLVLVEGVVLLFTHVPHLYRIKNKLYQPNMVD